MPRLRQRNPYPPQPDTAATGGLSPRSWAASPVDTGPSLSPPRKRRRPPVQEDSPPLFAAVERQSHSARPHPAVPLCGPPHQQGRSRTTYKPGRRRLPPKFDTDPNSAQVVEITVAGGDNPSPLRTAVRAPVTYGPAVSGEQGNIPPLPRANSSLGLARERHNLDALGLPPRVVATIQSARASSTRTRAFRKSNQLFVAWAPACKGKAISKQRLSHWLVEAIVMAYGSKGVSPPSGLRAHSTRGVAASWDLFRGVSMQEICSAAGWASPHTFVRFYHLDVTRTPVAHSVLGVSSV
ncbi:hypothetical protein SKAU_G00417670 [Synaphobranchus kaupii]|uniref:Tyr recombinase domain-containing protein n=1 Tax=Synaphobranchus kaupii TaxID=118154 RepID=A0A9Q1E5Z8_SYNKA|nr:hypothetical protein SKAU_G00417670 [Synaphobranchus kaupii]